MKRTHTRSILHLTILSFCLLFPFLEDATAAPKKSPAIKPDFTRGKPNIILILADDWGYGDIAVQGRGKPAPYTPNGIQEALKTPSLDKMAAEGTRYTQFYQNAAHCCPTRASIMKGQFSRRHGAVRGPLPWLPATYPILPQLMKDAGYATAQYGKWHLQGANNEEAATPSEYGIDEHMLMAGGGNAAELMPLDVEGWNHFPRFTSGQKNWRQWASSDIMDAAISFIERHQDQPFFINAWIFDTHWPLSPLPEQKKPYSHIDPQLAAYYAAATDSDKHIGRLLAKIKELGIDKNTMVIFCSDNGPEVSNKKGNLRGSTAGLRGGKRSGYEGGIRSPFIVWWPGTTPAGAVDNTTVISGADLLPSFVSLAGGKLPVDTLIDGEDMSYAFKGHQVARTRPLLYHLGMKAYLRKDDGGIVQDPSITSPLVIARDGKWKLLQNPNGSGVELYDIFSDPYEKQDVAQDTPEVVAALQKLLDTWMKGDTNIKVPTGPVPDSVFEWPGEEKGSDQ